MVKPFSIQAPEAVAKEYGGNKQRIAQAAQMGIIDPTAAVLAGMFIDRMRGAQTQEAANPPTVAQQVMGGIPAAPAAGSPLPPAGGLGAPPMAPAPQMPEGGLGDIMPQEEAPMGMAEGGYVGPYAAAGSANVGPQAADPFMQMPAPTMQGGLDTLSVPDVMFDEPDNGGYAGGGLVAFADGGGIDFDKFRRAIIAQESGGDYGVTNAEGSGAMGAYQFMPDTARALAKRLGLPYRPDLMVGSKGRSAEGKAYQDQLGEAQLKDAIAFGKGDVGRAGIYHFAGPNEGGWKAKTRDYEKDILRRYSGSKDTGEIPERDLGTAQGRAMSAEDALGLGRSYTSGLPREELERAKKYALEELDPATQEKNRKGDMWQALAEMGFRMAASESPYVLQAIGEAATATLPGIDASKKERKSAKEAAIRTLMSVEDVDRKAAVAGVELGMDIYKSGLSQEQFKQQMAFREKELASVEARTEDELNLKRLALTAQTADRTDFDKKFAAVKSANPGISDMQVLLVMQKNGLLGTAQSGVGGEFPGAAKQEGGAQPGGDITIVGSRPAQ